MEVGKDGTVVVGLLTDPGLPAEIARGLARDLPAELAERLTNRVRWEVKVALEPLEVAPHPERMIDKARQRVHGTKWDIAIAITVYRSRPLTERWSPRSVTPTGSR